MKRRENLLLALIIMLGIVLRILWWNNVAIVIENEGVEYVRLAENMLSGEGYKGIFGGQHVFFPPLYPALIGIMSLMFGDFEVSARVVSLISGIGIIILVWFAGRNIFSNRAGLIAALLVSCHPTLIALSVSTYSEGLFLFFGIFAVTLSLVSVERISWLWAAAAGVAWAAAYLVRPEGLVFGAIFVAVTAVAAFTSKGRFFHGVVTAVAGCLAFAVIATPYIVDLSQKADQFRWEGKSGVNSILDERQQKGLSYSEAARGLDQDGNAAGPMLRMEDQTWVLRHRSAGTSSLASRLMSEPFQKMRSIVTVLYKARYLASPWIFALAIVGLLATAWWRRKPWYGAFFALFGALLVLVAMSAHVPFARYLIPILPITIIWAAGGIDFLSSAIANHSARAFSISQQWSTAMMSIILSLSICVAALGGTSRLGEFSQARLISVQNTGVRIGEDFRHREPMTSRRPVIAGIGLAPAYYAGGVLRYLAYGPEDMAIQYLYRMSPDYIVMQKSEAMQAPYLRAWLETGIPSECAQDLPETDGSVRHNDIRVWVWEC